MWRALCDQNTVDRACNARERDHPRQENAAAWRYARCGRLTAPKSALCTLSILYSTMDTVDCPEKVHLFCFMV